MGTFVNEKIAMEAAEKGTLLGVTDPCRETKYSFWKVYKHDDKIIACVCNDDSGIACGEEITIDEIPLYVDDAEEAINRHNGL